MPMRLRRSSARRKYCPGKAHFRSIHSRIRRACVIVARWFEYLLAQPPRPFRFDILSGKLSVDARYHFDTRLSPVNLQMTEARFSWRISDCRKQGSREPVLTVPSFGIDGISLDLSKRELESHRGLNRSGHSRLVGGGWGHQFQTALRPSPSAAGGG